MFPIDFNDNEVLDFLKKMQDENIKYLLIGGIAISFHGCPRPTKDLDVWIKDSEENVEKLKSMLTKIEVAEEDKISSLALDQQYLCFNKGDYGLAVEPMKNPMAFDSLDFDSCYDRAVEIQYQNITFRVIHPKDLLKEKMMMNRSHDQGDIEYLKTLE